MPRHPPYALAILPKVSYRYCRFCCSRHLHDLIISTLSVIACLMVCNEYNYNITRLSWLAIYLRIFLSADCLTGFFFSVKRSMNVLIHYDSLSFFTATMLSMYGQHCIHMNTIYLFFCGSERDRTDDLLNANQALSQLSYGPMILFRH